MSRLREEQGVPMSRLREEQGVPMSRLREEQGVPMSSAAAGLADAEVAARIAEGKTNDAPGRASRSVADIVRADVFTRINAIHGCTAAHRRR